MKRWVRMPAIEEIATIEPPPRCAIACPACLMVRKLPVRFTSIVKRHISSGVAKIEPPAPAPALATAMSSLPVRRQARSTAAATPASSVTSQACHCTEVPAGAAASSPRAASSSFEAVRPMIVTDAPSASSRPAHARPMPLPPPVTRADWPARTSSPMIFSSPGGRSSPRASIRRGPPSPETNPWCRGRHP